MASNEVTVTVTADTSQAMEALDALEKRLKALGEAGASPVELGAIAASVGLCRAGQPVSRRSLLGLGSFRIGGS